MLTVFRLLMFLNLLPVTVAAQLSGCEQIVDALNNRYFQEKACNPGQNTTACNGLLLRTMSISADSQQSLPPTQYAPDDTCKSMPDAPWCLFEEVDRNVLSYSYLHQTVTPKYGMPLYPNDYVSVGYIVNNQALQASQLCAFPLDGLTVGRDSCGCGDSVGFRCDDNYTVTKSCAGIGVNTAQQYQARYMKKDSNWDHTKSCSFTMDDRALKQMFEMSELIFQPAQPEKNLNPLCADASLNDCPVWNEIVMKYWPDITFQQMPIEAIYYIRDVADKTRYGNQALGKILAKHYASLFPKPMPVISIDIDKIHENDPVQGVFTCDVENPFKTKS